jgi:hypothetical protein
MTSLPPFSATSPWNTTVPIASTYKALNWPSPTGYNYSVAWDTYSTGVYVASSTDPLVTVTYPGGWGYPGGTIQIHMPADAVGAAGTDGAAVVIDNGVSYDFWQLVRTPGATTATASAFGEANITTGTGFGSSSPFLGAGITAIGDNQLGGLITQSDAANGAINHALAFAVDGTLLKSGFTGPAIAGDASPTATGGIVQEGEHLAISPNTPMPSGLSALGQEVFTAMQKYGAYVIDQAGGVSSIALQSNAFDAATATALWHDMGSIAPLLETVTPATSSSGSGATVTPQPTVPTTPQATNPVTTPTPAPVTTPVTTPPPAPVTTQSTDPVTPTAPTPVTPEAAAPVAPTINWVAANGSGVTNGAGTVGVGATIRLAFNFSETVDVTGSPTVSLNTGGVAQYVSGSGSSTLQFDYTVKAGQNAADLAITGYNLAGVTDAAGDSVNLSGAPTQPAGTLIVNTKSSISGASKHHQAPASATTLAALTSAAHATLATSDTLLSSATTGSSNVIEFTTAGDGVHDRRLVLLGQYAASSFHSPSLTHSGSSLPTTSAHTHFLATPKSHA